MGGGDVEEELAGHRSSAIIKGQTGEATLLCMSKVMGWGACGQSAEDGGCESGEMSRLPGPP